MGLCSGFSDHVTLQYQLSSSPQDDHIFAPKKAVGIQSSSFLGSNSIEYLCLLNGNQHIGTNIIRNNKAVFSHNEANLEIIRTNASITSKSSMNGRRVVWRAAIEIAT